ncbi:MAG: hypothetical protein IT434_10045 [Phycisphaerales bacterium]|nr:hypothetical protein [Phycisphaerales bacterium]
MGHVTHWQPENEALIAAMLAQQDEQVVAALKTGADPNIFIGDLPITCALAGKPWAVQSIEYLTKIGSDDCFALNGLNPLMIASAAGSEPGTIAIFDRLVAAVTARYGTQSIRVNNCEGVTAFDFALRHLNPHQILRLKELGAEATKVKPNTVNSLLLLSTLAKHR